MAVNPEVSRFVCEAGALPVLVQLLKRASQASTSNGSISSSNGGSNVSSTSPGKRGLAVRALATLSEEPTNRPAVIAAGAVPVLKQQLRVGGAAGSGSGEEEEAAQWAHMALNLLNAL